ncbi:MAG: DUF4936 family protein [Burkholderiales bacterium]|nr:DUF4936 family protein [Burkholderiales bacterium]
MPAERPPAALPPGRRWFIYYRVPAARRDEVLAALRSAQAELRVQCPGLWARVMQRADTAAASSELTLMECYGSEAPAPGLSDDTVRAAIAATVAPHVAPWLIGERHAEVFDPCA